MKNLMTFVLIFAAFAVFAQTNKVAVKTLPLCDTINVVALGLNVEIIETIETFSRLEIETSINQNLNETTARTIQGTLGVQVSDRWQVATVVVSPVKSDENFSVSVGGNDIELKRSYKLFVPRGTTIKR
jgi:hypothetical protein